MQIAEGLKLNGFKFVWSIVACCYPKEWSRNNIGTFWCAITYKAHCTYIDHCCSAVFHNETFKFLYSYYNLQIRQKDHLKIPKLKMIRTH